MADHIGALRRQLRYWSDQGLTALAEGGNDGLLVTAQSLNDELLKAELNHRREISGLRLSRRARENNRRQALGALSMGVLMHALLNQGEEVELADVTRQKGINTTMAIDMYTDANGTFLTPRLHVITAGSERLLPPSDVPGQWYREDGLYVQRAPEVDPSDELIFRMQIRGYSADFSGMMTLVPDVASVHPDPVAKNAK